MSAVTRKKLVVVGDGACGKTCLLTVFSKNEFPVDYVPTIFESFVTEIVVDNKRIELNLWDTAGQEDYDRLRPLSYSDTNVVVLCFSVDNPDSLENVQEKWMPEIKSMLPKVPVILVANKKDLRNDNVTKRELSKMKQHPVTESEGECIAKKIGAQAYIECSGNFISFGNKYDPTFTAKHKEGVNQVFETAARVALHVKTKKRHCTIA
ncbi:Ras-like GTP-binding protein isoform 1 [Schistosoma japonicum]|uniref:Ras-like GTP-binding protein isoform 1 n=1 Tax=Schistosoma japonicum TaxID=6182 RepID=A0A4Z2CUB6_SCHJA|nr:Ras-like GTP-binding protein isoform 1 [Schistosoma japonicum]